MSFISYGISVALGVLFGTAAIDKSIHFRDHLDKVKKYQIIKHHVLLVISTAVILVLEALAAVSFLTGWTPLPVLMAAAALQAVYIVFISINLIKGNKRIACGCGGLLNSSVLSWWLIVRNGFFILCILAVHFFRGAEVSTSGDEGFIFIAALTVFFFLIMQNMIRTETERS
ncbi:MauE/DoxX family redox-associated membrane protein [Lysinibacillus sphaericus]